MRFYSSSLLFVDANHHASGDDGEANHEDEEGPHPYVDVRMIDFAHVGFRQPPAVQEEGGGAGACHHHREDGAEEAWDEDYLYGLRSLIRHLRELRERHAAVLGEGRD